MAIYKSMVPSAMWAQEEQLTHLALIWGMTPHAYNVERMKASDGSPLCRSEYRLSRDLPVLGGVLTDVLGDASEQFGKPFCAFHVSMPMYFLSAKPEIADQLLQGRIVVYGADLQSVGDNAYTPLHNAIAGAHVHAMALDNLLRLGSEYPRAEGFSVGKLNAGTVFTLIMVFLVAVLSAFTPGRASWDYFLRRLPPLLTCGVRWSDAKCRCRVHWSEDHFSPGEPNNPSTTMMRLCKVTSTHVFGIWPIWLIRHGVQLMGALALLVIVGATGLYLFNLGVLSWLEYAFLPILLSTFKGGEKYATWLDNFRLYVRPSTYAMPDTANSSSPPIN